MKCLYEEFSIHTTRRNLQIKDILAEIFLSWCKINLLVWNHITVCRATIIWWCPMHNRMYGEVFYQEIAGPEHPCHLQGIIRSHPESTERNAGAPEYLRQRYCWINPTSSFNRAQNRQKSQKLETIHLQFIICKGSRLWLSFPNFTNLYTVLIGAKPRNSSSKVF
jgi:hypothetical protein